MNQQTEIAGYRILRKLGHGEHGIIYLGCRKESSSQLVAIKQVSEHYKAISQAQFKVLPKLKHPNIIRSFQTLEEGDSNSIILEYASNGDLQFFTENNFDRPIPQEQLIKWLCQISLALHYLHYEQRVLHRDIKTKNILVMQNGLLKLGDFGTSRQLLKNQEFAMTSVGTPYYLSPEAVGLSKYNNKSDVWGLGCVMFELCTGRKPFQGVSLNQLIKQILNQEAQEIPTCYSEWFRNLVRGMLQKNPQKRITIESILERGEIRQAFMQLRQQYQKQYKDLVYPVADLKTKKYCEREQMSRVSFCAESLKTAKNQKSIKQEMLDWKKETQKKEPRKVDFEKFKDRSLKSIIEKRKKIKNFQEGSEGTSIRNLCSRRNF